MNSYYDLEVGDLANVIAYYRDRIECNGLLVEQCKYGTHFKILTNDGEIRQFDTVYYYLEALV